jgi:hypothetical protein
MIAEKDFPTREIPPKTHRVWLEEQEDEYSKLEKSYCVWLSQLAIAEDLFKRNVYENQEFTDSDARQHRYGLCKLMASGEKLAFDFLVHGEKEDAPIGDYVASLDQKLGGLRRTLHLWHGPVEDQKDVPESFKNGMQEVADGKVVEMERAFTERP